MNRRFARWIGPVLLLLPQLLVFGFGTDPLAGTALVMYLSLTLGGLLLVVAGYRTGIAVAGRDLPWYVFAGVATVSIGIGFAVSGIGAWNETRPGALLYAGSAVVGGGIIVAMGIDVARGGRHFRVTDG